MELQIGLLMNILGNDLYDRCPRFAKWISRLSVGAGSVVSSIRQLQARINCVRWRATSFR
ncbi:hypothetical protein [Methylocella sp.]|uniref:hypothetical protein n=1 Tax=Methylocella sp. TaxID=1978226 RepID=UPI0037851F7D